MRPLNKSQSRSVIRFILGAFFVAFGVRADSPREALRITLTKGLFQAGLNAPIDAQNKSISEYVMGTAISGTAITTGNLSVQFMPGNEWAGIWLRIDTETNSYTIGNNTPRWDIDVNIDSTAYTRMTSWKPLFLLPDRVATNSAQSSATTSLTYNWIGVEASGLFWRLKTRIAERRAWEQAMAMKSYNEQRVSQQAATEMNGLLDSKAEPVVATLNRDYHSIFYKPLFLDGAIPGSLHYSSTESSLTAGVSAELPADATEPPAFGDATPLSLRMHESLPSAMAARVVAGKHYNEEDLEELLILNGIPSGLGRYKRGDSQIEMDFCHTEPFAFHFRNGTVELDLCTEQMALGNAKQAGAHVKLTYTASANAEGAVELKRVAMPALDNAISFAAAVQTEVVARLARIFPEKIAFGNYRMPGKLGPQGELKVSGARFVDGWVKVEWWLDQQAQN